MAELPPIKKPRKQSSKGLSFFFAPTKGKNLVYGGERGIRTLDSVATIHAFQAC